MSRSRSLTSGAALVVILAAGCQSGPPAPTDDRTGKADKASAQVSASGDARHDVLAGIWAVRSLEDQEHNVVLRLFETGGGDPAMNGDMLVLNIMSIDPTLPARSFETGINVRAVQSTELNAATSSLMVKTTADTADANGNIGSVSRTFVLTYSTDKKGVIGATLSVQEKGAAAEVVRASSDGRWDVLEGIWAVRSLDDERHNVVLRLFETGGGDPAMNGDMLLLNVASIDPMEPARTFETGINVGAVQSMELDAAAAKLVVKASADTADGDGNIGSEAQTFALTYAVDERGVVGDKLSVQRVK